MTNEGKWFTPCGTQTSNSNWLLALTTSPHYPKTNDHPSHIHKMNIHTYMCTRDKARDPSLVKLLNGSAKGVASLIWMNLHQWEMSDVALALFKGVLVSCIKPSTIKIVPFGDCIKTCIILYLQYADC